MSKGKEFPPRLVVPRDEVNAEGGFGTYFAVWTPADPFVVHPTEDIEYLSSSEHSHLLAEARREGRAEAYRDAEERASAAFGRLGPDERGHFPRHAGSLGLSEVADLQAYFYNRTRTVETTEGAIDG